jgi:hypothetical protein
MENQNDFKFKEGDLQESAQQFRIEVAEGENGRYFYIKPLGHARYEIRDDEGIIGSVQLDENDHAHCESQGCELDLPLIHSIRDQIRFHEGLKGI